MKNEIQFKCLPRRDINRPMERETFWSWFILIVLSGAIGMAFAMAL